MGKRLKMRSLLALAQDSMINYFICYCAMLHLGKLYSNKLYLYKFNYAKL